jgi:hypothetical protein
MGSKLVSEKEQSATEGMKKNRISPKLMLIIIIFSVIFIVAAGTFIYILYEKSGYRNATGTFGYTLTYNTRKYEFLSSNGSIDMYQIIDLDSAECDCYVYVATYDPTQNLQDTLDVVNNTDGTELAFMNTTVGSEDYPAIFVDYISESGGYVYLYYINYNDNYLIIQTQADKSHQEEIDKMVDSFKITD